jgi:branched-chain amino acid transport system substrate-binding protein
MEQHLSRRGLLGAASALSLAPAAAFGQQREIRLGVIYDYTGPFAGGGSLASAIGTKHAIEMINERGGVEGHRLNAIYADAQSRTEVAINEMTRLLEQERVDIIMGVFSSAHCVPMAQRVNQQRRFMWANVCVASSVFKERNLEYVFRAQVHSDQFGEASCQFIADVAQSRLGRPVNDVRVAIIYEDGPYGAGVAAGNESKARELGLRIVLKEGYAATAPDLSSLVTKLRRERPDVILHTGYNPDITLFLRQSRELGLRWRALIGHGAGYGQIDRLQQTFRQDANYIFNVDPVAAQLLNPATLAPGLGDVTAEMVRRYRAETNVQEVPPHTSMGFNQTWILLTDVLPRAIRNHGGFTPDALRQAAMATDIPDGGTIQGYGVRFNPAGHAMAGQNARSTPVVMQYVDAQTKIVWPASIKTADPVIPLPAGHAYAIR